jgi:aspartyl/asparaginyl beta-hydroxylase (cupin superfamily)
MKTYVAVSQLYSWTPEQILIFYHKYPHESNYENKSAYNLIITIIEIWRNNI